MRYQAMADYLKERMEAANVSGVAGLGARLTDRKATTHPNMIARWLKGEGRPQGHRLEAVLDGLGVIREADREAARRLAYFDPVSLGENREEPTPDESAA